MSTPSRRDVVRPTIAIVGLTALALMISGLLAFTQASSQLMAGETAKYRALMNVRRDALEDYLNAIAAETRYWADNLVMRGALETFRTAWRDLGEDPQATLRRIYIQENPNPIGRKHDLEFAPDGSDYSEAHASYHSWLRGFLEHRGYYDVFLIDPSGNLVYTAFKEDDFATNLVDGPYAETGLGEVFRAARDDPTRSALAFADFAPYAPSHGDPASFIASPVIGKDDALIGVLAFQMPIDRLNRVMQVADGMGKTGETYVVGRDLLMRSDSRFSEESTILATKVDTVTVHKALANEEGAEVTPDYRGIPVLSVYGPLEFAGVRWAVMSEIDEAEVLQPIHRLRNFLVIATLVVIVLAGAALGITVARVMNRPVTTTRREDVFGAAG